LARKEWPPGIQPQPRSLAALFSKFDRGIELEWLVDRPQAQTVLSLVLTCPLGVIQAALEKTLERADEDRARWRLWDVAIARPIELSEEWLPPGIPESVGRPSQWNRLIWNADSGDGVPLVAAWLRTRELARCIVVRTWEEALGHLDSPGPLFVELQGDLHPAQLPARDGLCIATKGLRSKPGTGWQVVQPPAVSSFLEPLLDWLHERLPRDGHFNRELALRWFEGPVKSGVVDCFQTALGLAGVLDEIGVAKLRGRPIHQLASEFMERRLIDASLAGSAEAQWLKKLGFDVLVGMAKRALTDSPLPWEAARTHDEWMELVPVEFQRSVDVEWTSVSLARAGTRVTASELEKALSDVPPGSFRVVRALLSARVLEPDGGGMFRLSPRWLGLAARDRAENAVLSDSPFEWGEALLRSHAKDRIRRLVFERAARAEPEFLDSLIELDDHDAHPGFVMALETLVCAVGRAVLNGAEFEPEQLAALVELQAQFSLDLGGRLYPRFIDSQLQSEALGAWLLSVWALTEEAQSLETRALGWLNPWERLDAVSLVDLGLAIESIAAHLESEPTSGWVFDAMDMVSRVIDATPERQGALNHPIALHKKIDAASSFATWQQLESFAHGLGAASRRVEEWPTLAAVAWTSWLEANVPQTRIFESAGPQAGLLWPHLPGEVFDRLLEVDHPLVTPPPYDLLSSDAWLVLLAHKLPVEHGELPGALGRDGAEALPHRHLDRAVRGAAQHQDRAALEVFWERDPERVLARALQGVAITAQDDTAGWQSLRVLFDAHSPTMTASLVLGLREQLQRDGLSHSVVSFGRLWLHGLVARRQGPWREAYALLAEIELRLSRVQQARRGKGGGR
jgi:hypothetical protein